MKKHKNKIHLLDRTYWTDGYVNEGQTAYAITTLDKHGIATYVRVTKEEFDANVANKKKE